MAVVRSMIVTGLASLALAACSQDNPGVLPENMAEENLPAVETVQENDSDVDVTTVDVGEDAVAIPAPEQ